MEVLTAHEARKNVLNHIPLGSNFEEIMKKIESQSLMGEEYCEVYAKLDRILIKTLERLGYEVRRQVPTQSNSYLQHTISW